MIPQKVFLTKGAGQSREKLASFEMALRDAGIAQFNLVRVSSIFPPGCRVIPRQQGLSQLSPGQVVYCVMADIACNEPNRLVAASIGLAIPADKKMYGYLSEHHTYGLTERYAGDYAEDLAAQMLASTMGITFEEDMHYDARKAVWKLEKKIVTTRNITQTAVGGKKHPWTTVLAAAVFV